MDIQDVEHAIRDVPDFPKPGILFKDITPLFSNPELFKAACAPLLQHARDCKPDRLAAIESRGFLFGSILSTELSIPLFPVRKKGKLPADTFQQSYALEYGEAILEVHRDAADPGDRVLIIDDLLATGGTAAATVHLIRQLNAVPISAAFLIELQFLNGRKKLGDLDVYCPIVYD